MTREQEEDTTSVVVLVQINRLWMKRNYIVKSCAINQPHSSCFFFIFCVSQDNFYLQSNKILSPAAPVSLQSKWIGGWISKLSFCSTDHEDVSPLIPEGSSLLNRTSSSEKKPPGGELKCLRGHENNSSDPNSTCSTTRWPGWVWTLTED